jgi:staphylococcal nuclease domain-containing protein 1
VSLTSSMYSLLMELGVDVAELTKLMSDFSLHHRSAAASAPSTFSPKSGELVSAKFTEDNQW